MLRDCLIAAMLAITATILAQPAAAQQAPVPVSVGKASRADVPVFKRGIGTVDPFQSVLVRARVDGTIDQIAFTEGQTVKRGDLLTVVDPRPYQAVYDQAVAKKASDVAQLGNAKKDLARYADLARSDFASRQSVDTQSSSVSQYTANIEADDAAIAAAKLNLDFTRIVAPIEGRIGLRLVDPGNIVHANDSTGIVVINQIHPITVLFTLPQDEFPVVQDAMLASGATPLKVTAYTGDEKRLLGVGTLLTVDNAIDTSTGTIKLKAVFPNADDRLWPGQFVNAHLQMTVAHDAITVPSAAIQRGVNGLYVYVVKANDVVAVQSVDMGQDDGATAIVTKGLSDGDLVVTAGQSRLTAGTRVAYTSSGNLPASGTQAGSGGGKPPGTPASAGG